MDTKLVKTYNNVQFDEGMNDLGILTPNSRQLQIDLSGPLSEDQEEAPISIPPTLDSQHTPLSMICDVPVRMLYYHYTLGVILVSCPDRDRIYLKGIIPRKPFSKINDWKNKFRGSFIFQIQNTPAVTLSGSE